MYVIPAPTSRHKVLNAVARTYRAIERLADRRADKLAAKVYAANDAAEQAAMAANAAERDAKLERRQQLEDHIVASYGAHEGAVQRLRDRIESAEVQHAAHIIAVGSAIDALYDN